MSSYSKRFTGSFRLAANFYCIFTASSISLSLGWNSTAIITPFVRVGTYPTKEFRYLRTVIVTAAVYRDFDQKASP